MDGEVVRRAQHGDREAFDMLAVDAYDRLFVLAYRILRETELSKDAVQECLVSAWRGLRTLRDVDRWEAWIQRLLINACYREARRTRRRPIDSHVVSLRVPAAAIDVAGEQADRDQLERAFRRLPIEQRAVLVLHHYLGLRLPEIAELLGAPEGTIRSRLHYGTMAMRAVLEADARSVTVAAARRSA
jgi:RNA polymerase sigma-70 factor (ECF subfamily)